MVIAFTSWLNNDRIKDLLKRVGTYCKKRNHTLVCGQKNLYKLAKNLDLEATLFKNLRQAIGAADVIIAVGGDGTILDVAQYAFNPVKPIIGVNYGLLGFITAIKTNEIETTLLAFEKSRHQVDRRYMLEIDSSEYSLNSYALNECTLFNSIPLSMLNISMFVEHKKVGTYIADGLVVATSTGSTAYSLSCNGPIVSPNLRVIIVTPISPHALTHRPLVLPGEQWLGFDSPKRQHIKVGIDGKKLDQDLSMNSKIKIRLAPVYIDLVVLNSHTFF